VEDCIGYFCKCTNKKNKICRLLFAKHVQFIDRNVILMAGCQDICRESSFTTWWRSKRWPCPENFRFEISSRQQQHFHQCWLGQCTQGNFNDTAAQFCKLCPHSTCDLYYNSTIYFWHVSKMLRLSTYWHHTVGLGLYFGQLLCKCLHHIAQILSVFWSIIEM